MPSGGALASLTGLNAYNTPTAIAIAIIREISLQGRTPSRPSARPPPAQSPLPALPGSRPPRPSSITPAPRCPLPDAARRVLAVSHSERAVYARRALCPGAWRLPARTSPAAGITGATSLPPRCASRAPTGARCLSTRAHCLAR